MICFIALFVFGVLSIFSAKYRPFFRASVDCVFRRITLRPCNTTLEEQVKSETVAALMPRSMALAKFTNRHWEAISWAFTLLMFASLAYSIYGGYLFYTTGSCDPGNTSGCPINAALGCDINKLKQPSSSEGFTAGNASAKVTVIEFGDYACQFTQRAESGVQELLSKDGSRINFIYKSIPIAAHAHSREAALAAICANQSGKYWEYRAWLFANQQKFMSEGEAALVDEAKALGMDSASFESCMASPATSAYLDARTIEANDSFVCQTPTFFIGGKHYVGSLQYSQLKKAVDEAYASGG